MRAFQERYFFYGEGIVSDNASQSRSYMYHCTGNKGWAANQNCNGWVE